MNLTHAWKLFWAAAFIALFGVTASAQVSTEFWISMTDDAPAPNHATMYFGNDSGATYGIDSLNPTIKEVAGPPLAPTLDPRWVNITGRVNVYDNGLLKYDFIEPRPAGKDTFFLLLHQGDGSLGPTNMVIRWGGKGGGAGSIAARCDSMKLVDPTGYMTPSTINMAAQDSVYISDYNDNVNDVKFRIYVWNPVIIDGVHPVKNAVPESFRLKQNYPNPFNPTTTIAFDVQKASFVDVSVYNILGQKVTTLVSDRMSAKSYSTVWNGTNSRGASVGTGIYYVRMVATDVTGKGEIFSSVRKMLLMK